MILGQIVQFLSIAVRHKVGTPSSKWNCETDGHFIPPEDLSKKLAQMCKTRGADLVPNEIVPILSRCMNCKVQIGCRLAVNANGQVVKYTKALNTQEDLRKWFTEQNEQKFSILAPEDPPVNVRLACFCTRPSLCEVEGVMLCKEHLLQALLSEKFDRIADFRVLIERMQSGKGIKLTQLSNRKEDEAWMILLKMFTASELQEFFLHAPDVLSKLKVVSRMKKAPEAARANPWH